MSTSIVHNESIAARAPTEHVRGSATEQHWLEGFRILAAALALVWCLKLALTLAPARSFYAVAAGAALCVTLGLHTRVAAMLLALLLAANPHALDAWHAVDAPILAFVAFWLALLPTGQIFALDAKRRRKTPESMSLTPQLFTLQLVLLYADSTAAQAPQTWLAIQPASLLAAAIPAALFLARTGPLLAIPVAMQLAFHCNVAVNSGHYLANALLASSGAVLLRHSVPTRDAPHDAQATRARILDAPSAFALGWTLLLAVKPLAPLLHLSLPYEIATTVLNDFGWCGRLHGAP